MKWNFSSCAIGALLGFAITIAFSSPAFAGIPSPANSSIDTYAPGLCGNADAGWFFESNSKGELVVAVTVRDALASPVPACSLRLNFGGSFSVESALDPAVFPYAGHLCGDGTLETITDSLGIAEFRIQDGGGAGALVLDVTVTALCENPEIELGAVSDTFCVRSTDINGDQIVNFFDIMDYNLAYSTGTGWYADFNCTAPVNFFDTFFFLPEINQGGHCLNAVVLDSIALPDCVGRIDKVSAFSTALAAVGRLGLDRNGNLDCDDPDDMGTNFAVTGVQDTVAVVLEDVPDDLIVVGCVICVQDSNTVDLSSIQFEGMVSATTFQLRPSIPSLEVDPAILQNYPDAFCWTMFLWKANFVGFNGPLLAELRYTPAQDGCVGFVIDGTHSAYQLADAGSGYARYTFDAPGATCPPFVCVDPTSVAMSDGENAGELPGNRRLSAAEPNPFNPSTLIRYSLGEPGEVELSIHDVSGRQVATLVRGIMEAGDHAVSWDGRAEDGRDLSSGIYFVQLRGDDTGVTETQKITLLR